MVMNAENNMHGFDTVLVPNVNLMPVDTLPYADVHPGRSLVGTSSLSNEEHSCGLITQASIDFIRANKEKPFVLWCSYFGPHTPINPSLPWAEQYDAESITLPPNHYSVDQNAPGMEGLISKSGTYSDLDYHKKTLALYYGFVSQIDHNIGGMLKELDELGLMENTIVVYTADHGEMMAEHQSWTKGLTGYDATIRVPLIIKDATTFTGGRKTDKLAGSIDLLPTLLDLAGLEIPDNIQGESLRPSNFEKEEWREFIFNEIGRDPENNVVTVRSQTHKYVLFRKEAQTVYEQFFDLVEDPWEMKNLMDDRSLSEKISVFQEALQKWENKIEKSAPLLMSQK
jgi:arylsulfatase A-like enzyme